METPQITQSTQSKSTKSNHMLKAKGSTYIAHIGLQQESSDILKHISAWYLYRIGIEASTALIFRRALESLVADLDETERLLRKGKTAKVQQDAEIDTERSLLIGLSRSKIDSRTGLPKLVPNANGSFPTWEERSSIRVKVTAKRFQEWLLRSTVKMEKERKQEERAEYWESIRVASLDQP
jgi:hypothetical protein